MKRINDERLKRRQLENIRIAFIVQTLGLIAILVYDAFTKGFDEITNNPVWFVFIITVVVLTYLSMGISVEYERGKNSPEKSFAYSLIVLIVVSVILGILSTLGEEYTMATGFLVGGILFICGLIPIVYVYTLRKKNREEE